MPWLDQSFGNQPILAADYWFGKLEQVATWVVYPIKLKCLFFLDTNSILSFTLQAYNSLPVNSSVRLVLLAGELLLYSRVISTRYPQVTMWTSQSTFPSNQTGIP